MVRWRLHVKSGFLYAAIFVLGTAFSDSSAHSASDVKGSIEGLTPNGRLAPACRVAQAYIGLVASLNTNAIATLFAKNTEYLGPDGLVRHHPSEISVAFAKAFENGGGKPLHLKLTSLVPNSASSCLMQFEILDPKTGDYNPLGIDEIEVNSDNEITRLRPYCLTSQISYCRSRLAKKRGDN